MVKFEDFKSVKGHKGYVLRDLGDNGTGDGQWVELMRSDGWGFGAMLVGNVEDVITADEKHPRPSTGKNLKDIFYVPPVKPEPETVDEDV